MKPSMKPLWMEARLGTLCASGSRLAASRIGRPDSRDISVELDAKPDAADFNILAVCLLWDTLQRVQLGKVWIAQCDHGVIFIPVHSCIPELSCRTLGMRKTRLGRVVRPAGPPHLLCWVGGAPAPVHPAIPAAGEPRAADIVLQLMTMMNAVKKILNCAVRSRCHFLSGALFMHSGTDMSYTGNGENSAWLSCTSSRASLTSVLGRRRTCTPSPRLSSCRRTSWSGYSPSAGDHDECGQENFGLRSAITVSFPLRCIIHAFRS